VVEVDPVIVEAKILPHIPPELAAVFGVELGHGLPHRCLYRDVLHCGEFSGEVRVSGTLCWKKGEVLVFETAGYRLCLLYISGLPPPPPSLSQGSGGEHFFVTPWKESPRRLDTVGCKRTVMSNLLACGGR